MSLRERLGLEHPIVGAGLGGGLSRARLTAAIGEAGGLGQLGIMPPPMLRAELAADRERSTRPVAANLLLPFARRGHWELAREADAVVTFWGRPRRRTDGIWVHQCGSVEEAREAAEAGADGVIVQGVEAGGHVRGIERHLLLALRRQRLPDRRRDRRLLADRERELSRHVRLRFRRRLHADADAGPAVPRAAHQAAATQRASQACRARAPVAPARGDRSSAPGSSPSCRPSAGR